MSEGIRYVIIETKWGYFGLAADSRGLVRTVLPCPGRKITRNYLFAGMNQKPKYDANLLKPLQEQIISYFEGRVVKFDDKVPLSLRKVGPFFKKVLYKCRQIPYGKTLSYSQLARLAGKANAARAAGSAVSKNPLPLIIPCHRVICADGSIGKFSAFSGKKSKSGFIKGQALKRKLLEHEANALEK